MKTNFELIRELHRQYREEDADIAAKLSLTSCKGETSMSVHGYLSTVPPEGTYGLARDDTLGNVIALLRSRCGVKLPGDTTPKNFVERLLIALNQLPDKSDGLGGDRTSVLDERPGGAVAEPNLSMGMLDMGRGLCLGGDSDAFSCYMSVLDRTDSETATADPPIPRSQPTRNERLMLELDATEARITRTLAASTRFPQSLYQAFSLATQRSGLPTEENIKQRQADLDAILKTIEEHQ